MIADAPESKPPETRRWAGRNRTATEPSILAHDTWWQQPAATALQALGASPTGLSEEEAGRRLLRYGPNQLTEAQSRRILADISRRLANPLVLVLMAAGSVSALTGEHASAAIITAMVLLSVVLDQAQEHRAQSAAARLARTVGLRARVRRGGAEQDIDRAAIVPGDIVLLSAGSLVPADGLLLAAQDLFVQQSALTGEAFPVERVANGPAEGPGLDQARGALFMGTSVISGTATLLVCRTGRQTQIGAISHSIAGDRGDLAFENDIRRFGALILRITVFMVLFVLLVTGLAQRPWLESFLFAVALAVGLTPEMLPAVVTISLSRGAMRLERAQVIVKRLSAIHNLGSMDVLCTDKTGTLTEARIEMAHHVDITGRDSPAVLEAVYLNSFFESGIHTPLEDAVLAHGGIDPTAWRKLDEIPFDFERRRLSVLLERGADRRLIVKGAPDDVLVHCDRFQLGDAARPWTEEARAQARSTLRSLEAAGFRVLGVASKQVPPTFEDAQLKDENELVFGGFAAFLDPPKADARAAVADLRTQGVHVKVVTGDSELVTRYICESLGMQVEGVLLGQDIDAMDDRALIQRARSANLFCRVNPIQKNRVIRALRAGGHVVGYLGDGVNDAPALHTCDVGISVDTAADTARAAADLIMLRHSLTVLSAAVTEGRRTFANTRKYVLLGTSSNFGNMASMAAAAVFLPFLPMLPVQILLNNFLYDVVSAALPMDRVDPEETSRPQQWDMAQLRRFMFVIGPVSSVFDFATFALLLQVLDASAAQFQSGWFAESLVTQVLAVFVIRTRGSALAGRPHPALCGMSLLALTVALALPFTPMGTWFGLVPLPGLFYAALLGMAASYLVTLEIAKRIFYRHEGAA